MAMSETASMGGVEDRTIPCVGRVSARRIESSDVVTLDVETPEGPVRYAPGQFNMLTAFGVGESAISISGDPASGRLTHTVRAAPFALDWDGLDTRAEELLQRAKNERTAAKLRATVVFFAPCAKRSLIHSRTARRSSSRKAGAPDPGGLK